MNKHTSTSTLIPSTSSTTSSTSPFGLKSESLSDLLALTKKIEEEWNNTLSHIKCPLCGQTPKMWVNPGRYTVQCPDCTSSMPHSTPELAVGAWITRTNQEAACVFMTSPSTDSDAKDDEYMESVEEFGGHADGGLCSICDLAGDCENYRERLITAKRLGLDKAYADFDDCPDYPVYDNRYEVK